MNNRLTEIAFILDRSVSMTSLTESAITGFNSFLKDQLNGPGDANLSLVLFDHEYLTPYLSAPLREVSDLNTNTYIPRGSTALFDAVGTTINTLGKRLADTPEPDRPGHVIVAIFTDGYENSSKAFDLQKINEMITRQRDVYSWEFLFLAANQDAIATAAQMGIARHSAATIQHSRRGTAVANKAFSRSILESREQSFFDGKVTEYSKASMIENCSYASSDLGDDDL